MFDAIVTQASQNPAYALAALVGLSVGVCYGFDGWSGNTESADFKDTARVKNMTWVLGIGFVALIGDVKTLDESANRSLVVLAYFTGWLVATVVIVFLWGIVIGIGQAFANVTGRGYGYGTADSLCDYFFYGYRYYRAKANATQERQSKEFHAAYLEQLTRTIAAISSVTQENLLATVRCILGSMAAIVKSYHRDDDNRLGIRANIMLQRTCDAQLQERLLFVNAKERTQIKHCLELITYDAHDTGNGIVLPIPDNGDALLPGAPMAFGNPHECFVIDDTSHVQFTQGVPEQIRSDLNTYFHQKAFQSFGCIPMNGRAGTIGVVNVEAKIAYVFGKTEEERRQIVAYLLPFSAILAYLHTTS